MLSAIVQQELQQKEWEMRERRGDLPELPTKKCASYVSHASRRRRASLTVSWNRRFERSFIVYKLSPRPQLGAAEAACGSSVRTRKAH